MGQLQSSAVISLHGGPSLRVLLTANVVELEVRLSTNTLDFGCVQAGCCKVKLSLHKVAACVSCIELCMPDAGKSMHQSLPCVACACKPPSRRP